MFQINIAQGAKKHQLPPTTDVHPSPESTCHCPQWQIVEALRDPHRRFLDQNSSSRNHLDRWDLKAEGFFADLADGLASDLLFLKPKNQPNQPQRYQCVLAYPEYDPYPALDIHVTLSPRGEPPRVMIAVHESDTAQTLPRIYVDP